jgi:hypothetical protein
MPGLMRLSPETVFGGGTGLDHRLDRSKTAKLAPPGREFATNALLQVAASGCDGTEKIKSWFREYQDNQGGPSKHARAKKHRKIASDRVAELCSAGNACEHVH